jgi:hypothetical protein
MNRQRPHAPTWITSGAQNPAPHWMKAAGLPATLGSRTSPLWLAIAMHNPSTHQWAARRSASYIMGLLISTGDGAGPEDAQVTRTAPQVEAGT